MKYITENSFSCEKAFISTIYDYISEQMINM